MPRDFCRTPISRTSQLPTIEALSCVSQLPPYADQPHQPVLTIGVLHCSLLPSVPSYSHQPIQSVANDRSSGVGWPAFRRMLISETNQLPPTSIGALFLLLSSIHHCGRLPSFPPYANQPNQPVADDRSPLRCPTRRLECLGVWITQYWTRRRCDLGFSALDEYPAF